MNAGVHLPLSCLKPAQGPRRSALPQYGDALVSDLGDDHEMAEDFGNSLARAGDRIAGFVFGAGLLAFAWAVWLLI